MKEVRKEFDRTSFNDLLKLTERALDYLESKLKYSPSVARRYKKAWNQLVAFMVANHIEQYSKAVGQQFLIHKFGDRQKQKLTATERFCYNGTRMLTQFYQTGHIDPPIYAYFKPKQCIQISSVFEQIVQQFLDYKIGLGLSKSGERQYKRGLQHFFDYCEENNIDSIGAINLATILQYLNSLDVNKRLSVYTALWTLRGFMKYVYELGSTEVDYSKKIPKYKSVSQPQLPSTYTKEEIEKLTNSIDRSSPVGKRNYAIVVLASRLGMRASDIANLQFSHIDWNDNQLCIHQVKTGKVLTLPLLAEVGNAIIDYLKYGRPTSEEPYVFLTARPPYGAFSNSNVVTHVVQRAFQKTDIDISKRRFGPHSLRHSLSVRLLEEKTTLPVISEVLGHSSTDTTRYYLRLDLTAMRQCMLEVPIVPIRFYQQKGGVFFEK